MQLEHIKLEHLNPSKLNVRKYGAKDVGDLIPSIKANGILQPLLVRPDGGETKDGFEIIAGQRRYHACLALTEDGDTAIEALPCMIMDNEDDAAAIEASLAEIPPVCRWMRWINIKPLPR
ncbi:ParB/RepB/Spo0J family partition protein [Roseobacter litoralis]|uniref:ParB/RepB/Spo0J family partition protein n=1 Tax=Roseobacter litoralis TaxID=42443 RepID=UPI00248FB147|nr:ParB N-terminal domain-containing protein [Roseobacter litoralis]